MKSFEKILTGILQERILGIAIIVILIISFFSLHGDFVVITAIIDRAFQSRSLNFYEPIWGGQKAVSPPLAYLLDLFFYSFLRLIYPFKTYIYNYSSDSPIYLTPFLAMMLKLRYLFVYFIINSLFIKISKILHPENEKLQKALKHTAILSPLWFLSVFIQGNNDIYPVLLLVIALLFAIKKEYTYTMVFLGLSAATKNFSFFLFFPAAFIVSHGNWRKTILYLIVAFVSYILPYIPFLKDAGHFFLAGGEGLLIFKREIEFLGGTPLFLFLYINLTLYLLFVQKFIDSKDPHYLFKILIQYLFLYMSLFFVAGFFIPQWILWMLPFFTLIVYRNKNLFFIYIMLSISYYILVTFLWGNNLDYHLIHPQLYPFIERISSPLSLLEHLSPTLRFAQIFQGMFISVYIFFIYYFLKGFKNESQPFNKNFHYISFLPLMVYIAVNLLFSIAYIYVINEQKVELTPLKQGTQFVPSLTSQNKMYQTFESSQNKLNGFEVIIATYGLNSIQGEYQYEVKDGNCNRIVRKGLLDTVKIKDGSHVKVNFESIKNSKNKLFCLTIYPRELGSAPVTLLASKEDEYKNGQLLQNNIKVPYDLYLTIYYSLH